MIKACIFDLDGTLANTLDSMAYVANAILRGMGLKEQPTENFKYYSGEGADMLVRRCLKDAGDPELTHFEAAYARYREIFQANCMYQVKPYEGIPKLLEELKKRGMKIAVLSNKPHHATLDVIESLFGKDYFDVVQGQVDGVPIKPDPAGVFRILDRFGLTADEVLYMGDTATDMKTGKAAGAFTVGVLWGFRDRAELEEGHADAIIAQPLDLLKYCE